MVPKVFKIFLLFWVFLVFFSLGFFLNYGIFTRSKATGFVFGQTDLVEERRALEEELKKLEEEILQYEQNIQETQQKKKTLQNKIYILKNKIKQLDLQIYQSNLVIEDLILQIKDTEGSIEDASLEIEESVKRIIEILRLIYEKDQTTLVEILFSEGISEFFNDLVALEVLHSKNQTLLEHIKLLKSYLLDQKQSLDEEKEDMEKMVIVQTLQKREQEAIRKEQEELLRVTEGKEAKYQEMLSAVQKRAQEIRSRIFELIGVPEAPTFGQAYEIAKFVASQTGIRPALLLAVLTQESNIGRNVGQCFLVNFQTGEGVRAKTGQREPKTMNPKRDVPHFLQICKSLGRDPYNTPVSCPMKDRWGNAVGWGGAMGPAQFIPSTWMLYKDKVSAVTGKSADPWNIKDAFLATGLYLRDLGGTQNEFLAVMRYFSGYRWYKWEEFYGRSVLAIASRYEQDIKELERAVVKR